MEERLRETVAVLVVIVEACGVLVIIVGSLWAFARFVWVGARRRDTARRAGAAARRRGLRRDSPRRLNDP